MLADETVKASCVSSHSLIMELGTRDFESRVNVDSKAYLREIGGC